ncbi:MAG: T9SS type A sorting domain-containing protein, partial [Bacteroidetes bacterium]|nr:T9SS type A sorting domain-containing protein [Bacteroidota bacterium]
DTDNDGVSDCNDNEINSPCPNNVDVNGVSIDSDNDGTPDCNDPCPDDPNDTCNNCAAGDSDGDGVCDDVDLCPDFDDAIDTDGDGTPDGCDSCPDDRNKIEPGLCGCGNRDSESDRDGDGIIDCNDLEINSPCPANVDADGVSIDTDGDGTPDCDDLCEGFDDSIDVDNDRIPDGCDDNPYCRGDKLVICHENNGRYTTQCVSLQQLSRHASHPNDILDGPCDNTSAREANDLKTGLNNQLNIYPNPIGSNGLWIKFSPRVRTEKFTAVIYSLSGKKLAEEVFETSYNKERYFWDLDNGIRDKGVFILKLNDGNKTYYARLIK